MSTPPTTQTCRIDEDSKDLATAVLNACGLPSEVCVPSEKTARAMAQAREIRRQFDSIDDVQRDADGEAGQPCRVV